MSQPFWALVDDRYIDSAKSMIVHGWAVNACDGVAYEIWPSRPQERIDDVVMLAVILDDEVAIEIGRFGSYEAAQARFDEHSIELPRRPGRVANSIRARRRRVLRFPQVSDRSASQADAVGPGAYPRLMTSPPPPLAGRLTPPEFDYFADVVVRFVDAAESLLKEQLSHPFNIGSEAMRDRAASDDHPGTRSKQTLLTLATQQGAVGLEQCDLLRGIAAILRTDLVTLAPFPLARTSAVIAAKAWYVLTAGSKEERLRRFLNEELAALYGLPFPSDDEAAVTERNDRTADYTAVGATAGLEAVHRKKPKPWDAPILARAGRGLDDTPPPETQLVKDFYRASGLQEDELAGLPYSLLSAATHGRFRQAGLVNYASAGPSVGGVSTAAMHVTLGVTAQTTMYAAIATRTYLCALARYTAVPEAEVLGRLQGPTAEWSAITQQVTKQPQDDE